MSTNQEHELTKWFRNQVFRPREKPLEKFVLRNANAGYKSGEVEEFDLPSEQMDADQVAAFLEQITTAAQRDADAAGTKLQTYMLMALEMGAKTGPRHRFRVRGDGEEEDSGEEKPDKEGIISQLMRHNEALMRMATMGAQQTITTLTRQLESANTTISRLNELRQTAFDTVEEAKSKQHERELQLLMTGNDEERKNAAFQGVVKKLDILWPVIVNKMAGKKILSDSETSMLKEFVNGVSQEQFINIAKHLNEAQRIALMTIFKELRTEN
jgi:hypothetical protein